MISTDDVATFSGLVRDVVDEEIKVDYAKICPAPPVFCSFLGDDIYQETTPEKVKEALELAAEDTGMYGGDRGKKLDIILFDFALVHITRIARIIRSPFGNALLVGVGGTGRRSLSRLAAIALSYKILEIEITKSYKVDNWFEDIKEMLNTAGLKET
jgi:dynein heavy chain